MSKIPVHIVSINAPMSRITAIIDLATKISEMEEFENSFTQDHPYKSYLTRQDDWSKEMIEMDEELGYKLNEVFISNEGGHHTAHRNMGRQMGLIFHKGEEDHCGPLTSVVEFNLDNGKSFFFVYG